MRLFQTGRRMCQHPSLLNPPCLQVQLNYWGQQVGAHLSTSGWQRYPNCRVL